MDLSENLFRNITVIAELPIQVLNLSRCNIEAIESASFKDLQDMKVLDLSHNRLTAAKLSPHAFEVSELYVPTLSIDGRYLLGERAYTYLIYTCVAFHQTSCSQTQKKSNHTILLVMYEIH